MLTVKINKCKGQRFRKDLMKPNVTQKIVDILNSQFLSLDKLGGALL